MTRSAYELEPTIDEHDDETVCVESSRHAQKCLRECRFDSDELLDYKAVQPHCQVCYVRESWMIKV